MSIAKTSVKKPVTVIVIFLLLAILGVNAARNLPLELIPDMDIPYLIVSTSYPNASPEEVEDKVTKTLESSLSSVTGLKNISSTSSEGSSTITMEFEVGTDLSSTANIARDRIDLVKNYLPSDATNPLIVQMDMSMLPLMIIAVDSPTKSVDELKTLADETLSPLIEQIDGVASTSIIGGRDRQIKVEISKDRLDSYGLSLTTVAQMIAAQNVNASAGSINQNGIDYTIQTDGLFTSLDEIGNTVISYKQASDGTIKPVHLSEVADIYDTYKKASSYFSFGSNECVAVSVAKQSGKNTVSVANEVKSRFDSFKRVLPSDCRLTVIYDSGAEVTNSIQQVLKSAIEGALFAVIVLLIFLREFKSTALIAISMPLSILITLLVMYYSGFSINLMTLAGLSLGIGMLVDSSIVVIENIYTYRHRGVKSAVASVLGTEEMISALLSSTLTTCCVFIPMILYKKKLGMMGSIFNQLALTVIVSLLGSLVVAVTLIPVLTSKFRNIRVADTKHKSRFMEVTDSWFDAMDSGYSKSVAWVLHHKILFIAIIALLFVWACIQIPKIGFSYMPESESTSMNVSIELPKGTDIDTTRATTTKIADAFRGELKGIKMEATMVGAGMTAMVSSSASGNANTATIMYEFFSGSQREPGWDTGTTAKEKIERIKEQFPEATITVSDSSMMSSFSGSSSDLDIAVSSADRASSVRVAREIENLLNTKGSDITKNVQTSISDGLPKLSVVYDRDKMYSLGVNVATANSELKANIGGLTFGRYRTNGHEIDMVISLPQSDKKNQLDLENIKVTSSLGIKVPLSSFANIVEDRTATSIVRENQSNVIHVTANSVGTTSLSQAKENVQQLIEANIASEEGVVITYKGSYEDMMEALTTFIEIIMVAVLLVFAIMASQFESFRKPFIVLFTMPLALIGIVFVYKCTGLPFTVITAVGALILVGIVVNNGIVLVDYIGLMQKRGMSVYDSCLTAAKSRLRPVLMTTLTTVIALIPMGFFPNEGGEMIQPIGQTVFGGLIFSTIMTLYMMPVLYSLLFSRQERRKAKKAAEAAQPSEDNMEV